MKLENTKTGSSFILFLMLLLSISFLTPLYHSHVHTRDHHPASGGVYAFFHHRPPPQRLSSNHRHESFHLHIKTDIGIRDSRLLLKGISLKPDLCAETVLPASAEPLSCRRAEYEEGLVLRMISYELPSGLSPPAV